MCSQALHATALALQINAGNASTGVGHWSSILWSAGMILYGVVPECRGIASGIVSECIMSAKMVKLSASGTVVVVLGFYVSTTAKVFWRRYLDLKSRPKY